MINSPTTSLKALVVFEIKLRPLSVAYSVENNLFI